MKCNSSLREVCYVTQNPHYWYLQMNSFIIWVTNRMCVDLIQLMIYFKQFSYGIRKEQLAVRSVYCDFNRQQQLQNVES